MHAFPLAENCLRDPPPRTWRVWWRELPGYYRIGFRVVAILALLQLALAIRIVIGLIESPEIRHLRTLNVEIDYYFFLPHLPSSWKAWLHKHRLLSAYWALNEGLLGRSCHNVYSLGCNGTKGDLTDADVEFIANHFPNLSIFDVANVSATRFKCLERCSKMWRLSVSYGDVEDTGLPDLTRFPQLFELQLENTLVSDAIIPQLKQLSQFNCAYLRLTDVTYEAAIENWPDSRESPQVENDPTVYPECHGSIRWSDGQRSAIFRGPSSVTMKYGDDVEIGSYNPLERVNMLWEPDSWPHGDGEYQLSVKLGEYESAPVKVIVKESRPDVRRIEFLMPVTKAEALRSIEQSDTHASAKRR